MCRELKISGMMCSLRALHEVQTSWFLKIKLFYICSWYLLFCQFIYIDKLFFPSETVENIDFLCGWLIWSLMWFVSFQINRTVILRGNKWQMNLTTCFFIIKMWKFQFCFCVFLFFTHYFLYYIVQYSWIYHYITVKNTMTCPKCHFKA